jgi:hypothetical protein
MFWESGGVVIPIHLANPFRKDAKWMGYPMMVGREEKGNCKFHHSLRPVRMMICAKQSPVL